MARLFNYRYICVWIFLFAAIGFCGKRGLRTRLEETGLPSDGELPPPAAIASGPARGGLRQRQGPSDPDPGAVGAEGDKQKPKGPLNDYLKQEWVRGKLKTRQVQEIALASMQQGTPGMETLAQMGAWGKHPGNFFRAMKNVLDWPSGVAPLSFIELPTTKGPKTPHPVLWPHLWFNELYNNNRQEFLARLRGPAGAALQFWRNTRDGPFVANHPNLPEDLWPKIIPLGMHGDGGSFSKQDSVYVIS
jgi:hypothetical protein